MRVELRVVDLTHTYALEAPNALLAVLSSDERARAARFAHAGHGRRFALGRGWVRHVLARRLGCSPASLVFATNRFGRPELADVRLSFSVAHAGRYACVAIAEARVGVDLASTDTVFETDAAAAVAFSAAERRALAALPAHVRRDAFYRGWTLREALGKAVGLGFQLAPETLAVDVDPRRPASVRALNDPAFGDPGRWSVTTLESAGLVVALALEARDIDVSFYGLDALPRSNRVAAPPEYARTRVTLAR